MVQIVIQYVEETVLEINTPNIVFLKGMYVCDCKCIAPEMILKHSHELFNNFDDKLKLTLGIEINNKLNFLKLIIIKTITKFTLNK